MARSPTFQHFLGRLDAPPWEGPHPHDRVEVVPYLEALGLLRGDERVEAEDILIAKLTGNDHIAAKALAEVRCARAVPALIQATAATATPHMRVTAARALLRLRDTSGRPALVEVLRTHAGDDMTRSAAVELLGEFPHPDTDFLLEVAATDPACRVRSSAFDTALVVHGLATEHTRYDEVMRSEVLLSIAGRVLSSLTTVRREACGELRVLLDRWEAGATREELGLTWQLSERDEAFQRLIDNFESTRQDWPLDGLVDRTGRERVLLENLVLLRLAEDHRAVRAAAVLGVRRAVAPLRELVHLTSAPRRGEIESVIEELSGRS